MIKPINQPAREAMRRQNLGLRIDPISARVNRKRHTASGDISPVALLLILAGIAILILSI